MDLTDKEETIMEDDLLMTEIQNSSQRKGLIIFQTWHTVFLLIGVFMLIGISYATARIDIDSLKDRVSKLETYQVQQNRIEYNLRRLLEKNGLKYEEFGDEK